MPSGKVAAVPPRVAILPPVPVPYREPLFRSPRRARSCQSARDVPLGEPARLGPAQRMVLRGTRGTVARSSAAWQRSRTGRSSDHPSARPRAALTRVRADCIVSWEYGPATLRALAWARRRRVPVLVFSELTPWSDAALSALQRRVHRLVAPRAAGFIVARSQGAERLRGLGVDAGAGRGGASERGPGELAAPLARPGTGSGPRAGSGRCGRLVADKNLDVADRRRSPRRASRTARPSSSSAARGPLEAELRAQAERLGRAGPLPGARRRPASSPPSTRTRGRAGSGEHLRAVRRHAARGRGRRAAADRVTPGGGGRRRGGGRRERAS